MIPTSIDGTDITGATIDGTDVTEITVDGQTVFTATVEVNGLLVDDFADNKLTSRDDFATTALNPSSLEPATSNFTVTTRPEYDRTEDATVASQQVTLGSDSDSCIIAPIPSFTGELKWEVNLTSTNSIDFVGFMNGTALRTGNSPIPQDGYFFQQNEGTSTFAAIRRTDSGTISTLSTTQSATHQGVMSGTIDDSGNLEFNEPSLTASTPFDITVDHVMYGSKEGNTIIDFVIH